MVIFFVLVVAVVVLWLWKPEWFSLARREQAVTKVKQTAQQTYTKTRNWAGQVRLPFQPDKSLPEQFQQWLSQAALDKRVKLYGALPEDAAALAAWVDGLPKAELGHLVDGLAAFCHARKFELAWVADPALSDELRVSVEEAVALYVLAVWRSHNIGPLAAYKAWLTAPDKKENRAFAQKVYSKLVEAGLTPAPADLLLASDKERTAHVRAAIEKAAAENSAAFLAMVRETLDELAAAPKAEPASAAEPEPATVAIEEVVPAAMPAETSA